MPRVIGVDIPGKKRVEYALRYIYGVGPARAKEVVARLNLDPAKKADDLTGEEIAALLTGGFKKFAGWWCDEDHHPAWDSTFKGWAVDELKKSFILCAIVDGILLAAYKFSEKSPIVGSFERIYQDKVNAAIDAVMGNMQQPKIVKLPDSECLRRYGENGAVNSR